MKLVISIAALAVLICGWSHAAADESVWVTEDGDAVKIRGGAAFISDEDAVEFDVSELADGETRTFGDEDKQVTVTRDGDEVTIRHSRGDGDSGHSVICELDSDVCKIFYVDDEPGKVMLMIRKTGGCGDGEDCRHIAVSHVSISEGEPGQVVIEKTVRCDEDGNCEESEEAMTLGMAHAEAMATIDVMADIDDLGGLHDVLVLGLDDEDGKVFKIVPGTHVTLRCPEGDVTMRVKREEADDVYLCPKHSVPLEKVSTKDGVHRIMIKKKVSEDDVD
jgi:hypothetical protein